MKNSTSNGSGRRRGPMRANNAWWVVAAALGVAAPIASAFEIPSTPAGTWTGTGTTQAATKDTVSGIRTTVSVSGPGMTFLLRNNTTLQAASSTDVPAIPADTNGVQVSNAMATCQTAFAGDTVCTPGTLGTMTIAFTDTAGNPIPVRNPVLHFTRIGGSVGATVIATRLRSTTAGVSFGTPPAGSNLLVAGGNEIRPNMPGLNTTGSCPTAGCGSVPTTGTFSTLSFDIGAERSTTTNAWTTAVDAYFVTVSFDEDFGDAPTSYDGTTPAVHMLSDLALGATVDAENTATINGGSTGTPIITTSPDASATATADADDANPVFPALNENMGGQAYVVPVPYSGGSRAGQLCGWIDFNRNNVFDAGERACGATAAGSGTVNLSFTVPADVTAGTTVSRFRVGYTTAQVQNPNGFADSGEVEDHQVVIRPAADLAVNKTGPATAVQGTAVTYTITVANNGKGNVTGAQIADTVPANLTGVTWTCAAAGTADCDTAAAGTGATGTGNAIALNAVQLNAGAGNTVTLTVTGTATTTGTVTNTATVSPPAGVLDTNTANNSSSVTTTITPAADLAVVKTGPATVVQGNTVTYGVTVTNNGPSPVTGATIADAVPANLTGVTWTCPGCVATSGAGNSVATTANLAVGASVTLSITGTATTTGAITNTATVAPPVGTTDPTPGNNSSSVNTNITPAADLAVAKTGPASVVQGNTVTYTVTVTNNGPSNVTGAQLADTVPANLTGVSWTCVAAGTADCNTGIAGTGATGTGNAISLTAVQLNAGAGNSVTITVTGTATTTGAITNTATVTAPAGTTDPTAANNSSSVNTNITPSADLAVVKTGPATVVQGSTITYTIVATNNGPSNVTGAQLADTVPANITGVSWTCVAAGTADCNTGIAGTGATGTGNGISLTAVQLNAGAGNSVTITVTGTATTTGAITNTATITPPAGTTDPTAANNSSSVNTSITPAADLQVVKTGPASVVQGNTVTYGVTVTNNGPSNVTGATIADAVPANLTGVNWNCVAVGTADCDTGAAGTGATGTGNSISLAAVQLNAGAGNTITLTVTGTATTTGAITNTATVATPAGTTDPTPANNTSSVNTNITPAADLQVVKTGPATVVQGNTVTYTITVTNNGPSDVTGATIADTVPANLTGVSWTCVAVGTADCNTGLAGTGATGTGNAISLTAVQLNAGVGNTVTLTVTGTATTAGAITNTATVTPPAGTTDPTPASSSVNTTIGPAADLRVTKTGPATIVGGQAVTYTITATNLGPSNVTGATIADTVPADIAGVSWTCSAAGTADCDTGAAGTGATGTGNAINLTAVQLNAGAGNTITITVTGTAVAAPAAVITNTVTITPPAGTTDPVTANNTAATTASAQPAADLQVVKTGPATVVQSATGGPTTVTYTVTVTNNGPANVTGATIADTVPGAITNVSWTCVAAGIADCDTGLGGTGATGTGNAISLTAVQLNAGAGNRVTLTVTGTPTTTGAITNTATVTPPAGTVDGNTANNSSSVNTTITPAADLAITKTGTATVLQNGTVTYTILVTNNGPSAVTGATISDVVPSSLTSVSWTCVAAGTATCGSPAGAGNNISLTANIPAGAANTVTITVTATATTPGDITNTAQVQPPAGTTDPTPGNNTASQPTSITPTADLAITKTGTATAVQGNTVTYTITVTNNGPSNVSGASITDTVPANLTNVSWTCSTAGVADCSTTAAGTGATGTGNAINLPAVQLSAGAGNTVTIVVTGTATTVGAITNTANVAPPGGTTDPTPGNDQASQATTITPAADLAITKTGPATAVQGSTVTYTITATNNGPSNVSGATIADTVPGALTNVAWTCTVAGVADCNTAAAGTGANGTGNAISLPNVQINAGAANRVTITVTGTATTPGAITNTATIAPPAGTTDPTPGNDSSSANTTITDAADLQVTKSVVATPVVQANTVSANTVTYTVVVRNNGPSNVTGASLVDAVPSNLTNVSIVSCVPTGTAGCGTQTVTGNNVSLTGIQLNAGAANFITLTIRGTATTPGTFTNTATVTPPAGVTDPVPGNNSDSVAATITPAADLAIVKTGPATIVEGQPVTYTITVTNSGPSAVTGAQVADTVPAQFTGVTFTCTVAGAADCNTAAAGTGATGSGNAISLPNVQIDPGPANSLTITVNATATTPTAPAAATNTATVQPPAGTTDPNTANNSSSVNTTIFGIPAIAVTKADAVQIDTGAAGPSPGDTLRYTVTITNTGTGAANGVTISDVIDPNLQFVATVPPGGATFTPGASPPFGGSLATAPVTIPVNGSVTLVYDAAVRSPLPAGVTQVANQAQVSGTNFPTTPSNDPDTPTAGDPTVTPLTAAPLVTVDKAAAIATDAAPTGPSPGDVVEYTLTVTNAGNQNATSVALSDLVDTNVSLIPGSATATPGTITDGATGGPRVAATFGTIAGGGGTATVVYRVQVPNPIPAGVTQVENQAVVTGGNFPATLSNDPSTAPAGDPTVLPLTASPVVDVIKAASLFDDSDGDGIPSPGDTLLYTITVTNTGNQAAAGVTLDDTIDGTFSSITNVVASQGTASVTGQQLTGNLGTIPGGGGRATVTFRAVIPDPLADASVTSVVNQATVSGTNFPVTPSDDPATSAEDDPTRTPLTAAPLVSVTKQDTLFTDADGDGVPSPGDTLLYTITVTNTGNTSATSVALNDTVDTNVVLLQPTVQFSPAPATQAVTATSIAATFAAIPGRGGTAVATFQARVRSPLPPGVTQVANQAIVRGANFPSTPSNDPDTATGGDPTVTPLTATPRVTATKTDALVDDANGNGLADPGDELAYTITVTNAGNQDATSVRVADTVEANLILTAGSVQTSPTVAPTILGANITAVFPVVAGGGGTATVTYRARVRSPLPAGVTQVANQANITGGNFPPTTSDDPAVGGANDPTVTPVVAKPIVDSTKSATLASDADGNGFVSPGDVLEYVVTITNTGNQTAADLQFRDTVGPNLTVVPGSLAVSPDAPISSNLATTATTVQADFSGLQGAGGSATVSFRATITSPFPIGVSSVANQGNVNPGPGGNFPATPTDDPTTATADDPTVTPVFAQPVVTRTKAVALVNDVAPTGPSAGDTLRYTITLTNTGNQVASNAALTDLLDSVFTVPLAAGPTASGGGSASITGRTISASWGTILPGAANAVTLSFDATLPASLPAGVNEVRNQGNVTGANFTGGPTDDPTTPAADDPNVTPLLGAPSVSSTKTATLAVDADGDGVPSPGDTLAYEVVIRNTGNQNAAGVTYNDTIDPNLILLAPVTSTQGTPAIVNPPTGGGSISIPDVGTIPGPAGTVTITYQARVKPALPAGVSSVTNQGVVNGTNIPSSVTDDPTPPGGSDPTVTPLTLTPKLQSTKAAALVGDANGNGVAEPGDILGYTVTITNVGNQEATAVQFTDVIEPNLALVAGSAAVSPGPPTSAVSQTATAVNATVNSIPGGGDSAVITFRARIDNPLPAGVRFVQNQGTVSANNVPPFPTDDPATGTPDDPTRTPVVATPVIEATKGVAIANDVAPAGPSPGDTLLYTITITNTGNQTAANIAVSDIVDANLQVLPASITPDPGPTIGATTFTPAALIAPFGGTIGGTFTAIPGGGANATISFQATIKSPVDAGVTQVENQAQVTGANFPPTPTDDPRTATPGDPTVTPITAEPAIDATKNVSLAIDADGNGVPSPGDTLAYSIEVVNAGNREATDVVFADTIGANLTLVSGSVTVSQGTVTAGAAGGTTVGANLGSIAGGNNSATVGFRVRIANPLPAGVTQVANQGTVSGSNFGSVPTDDPRTGAADDPTVTPITASPQIAVDKAAALAVDADGNGVPSPGDTVLYTITIRNSGNQTATAVALSDIVDPTLVTISAVQASQGAATLSGRTITANVGDIGGGGQTATVSFRAQVENPLDDGVTQVANQAQVSGTNFPATPSNDPSTAQPGDPTVTPLAANPVVSATKADALAVDADGNGVPSPGDTLAYTIVITNSGNRTATGVGFADTFDPNVVFVPGSLASTPPAGAASAVVSPSGFAGEFPAIPGGGASATVTFRARIVNPLPPGITQVANQTLITPNPTTGNFPATQTDDPDSAAPDDPTVTPLTANPVVAVTKRDALVDDPDGNGIPSPGDTLLYTITVTNSGNAAATGVALSDVIDQNLSANTPQASQGSASIAGNSLSAVLGTIPGGGGTATVTYRATIANPLPAGVTQVANQAIASGNFPSTPSNDPDTPADGDPTITPLSANPIVNATKSDALLTDVDGNGVPSPGDTLLYTITVTNTGNQAATGVTLTDIVPPLLAGTNPQASQGTASITGSTLSANLGAIAGGGGAATVTFEAKIADPLPAGVTQVANQATVSGGNFPSMPSDDPATPVGDDPTVTPLSAAPIIAVDKTATLAIDADGNGRPSPGDTLLYTIVVRNTGNQAGVGAVVNDLNDPNVVLVAGSVAASQGTVTAGNGGGSTVDVDLGTIPGRGGTATVSYQARIANPLPAGVSSVSNQALVSGTNFPTTPSNDPTTPPAGDPTVTQLAATPVLTASKAATLVVDADGNGVPSPGDTLLYTVSIANTGNQAAADTVYADTIDANTTLAPGSVQPSQGSVTVGSGQSVGVAFGTVPGGATVTVSYRAVIAKPVPAGTTQVANQGNVSATGVPPVPTDDPATGPLGDPTVVLIASTPRLLVTKADVLTRDADGDGQASPGDELTYTAVVENAGNTAATGVVFNDTPDPNTTLVAGSVTIGAGGAVTLGNGPGDTAVAATIATLGGGGERVTISFRVRINTPLPETVVQVANQAVVTCGCAPAPILSDDPATNAQADPTITPLRRTEAPTLTATKSVVLSIDADRSGGPSSGDTIQYAVVVANTGTGTARNTAYTDTVDANTTIVAGSVSTNRGEIVTGQQGGAQLQIAIGDLPPGAAASIRYRVVIKPNLPVGVTRIRNQGRVTAVGIAGVATDDPSTGTAGDPTDLTVAGTTRLSIRKFGPNRAAKGTTTLYSIRVTNRGGSSTAGLVVTDTLPRGMVVAQRPRNATVRGRTVTWRLSSLAPGRSIVLTLRVRVTANIGVRLTNRVTARASNAPPVRASARTLVIRFVPPSPTG